MLTLALLGAYSRAATCEAQERGTCLSGICPTEAPHAETDDVAGSVSCLAL